LMDSRPPLFASEIVYRWRVDRWRGVGRETRENWLGDECLDSCERGQRLVVIVWRESFSFDVVTFGGEVWTCGSPPPAKEKPDLEMVAVSNPTAHDMRLLFRRFHRELHDGKAGVFECVVHSLARFAFGFCSDNSLAHRMAHDWPILTFPALAVSISSESCFSPLLRYSLSTSRGVIGPSV